MTHSLNAVVGSTCTKGRGRVAGSDLSVNRLTCEPWSVRDTTENLPPSKRVAGRRRASWPTRRTLDLRKSLRLCRSEKCTANRPSVDLNCWRRIVTAFILAPISARVDFAPTRRTAIIEFVSAKGSAVPACLRFIGIRERVPSETRSFESGSYSCANCLGPPSLARPR